MGGRNKLTDLQVIFLGTGGSIPTPQRGLSAIAIRRKNELLLFDCGEGTQRQMIQAGVGFHRKTKIFVTHMHGDHVLGLPGLLQTMSLLDREKKLEIYGPQGIKAFVEAITQTVQFTLTFPVQVSEIETGLVCEEREYEVYASDSRGMENFIGRRAGGQSIDLPQDMIDAARVRIRNHNGNRPIMVYAIVGRR